MRLHDTLYIGGTWRPAASGATFTDTNPWTGEPWAAVADGSAADAADAVDAAAEAQPSWAALPPSQRAETLRRVADQIEARRADIAEVLIAEIGSIPSKAQHECNLGAGNVLAAADLATQVHDEHPHSALGKHNTLMRVPVGVVSVVSPWNAPFILSLRGVANAVALGNTVVLKPSEESPVSGGLLIAQLFEAAGVPAGVLNVVSCSRNNVADVGDVLVTHESVRAISFTGSEAVGRSLAALAGQHLKKIDLELGGSDACVVLADADLDAAVDGAVFGAFHHAGQICMSSKRIVVEDAIADEFTDRFVRQVAQLKHGDPSRDDVAVGPVINPGQVAKLQAAVDDAVAQGATVLTGGSTDGACFEPTVLTDVTPDMAAYRDELFGPVRVIHRVPDADAAVAMANDSDYGLSAAVWTQDVERGLEIARRLDTGMAHVNGPTVTAEPHIPFGGMKASGMGRNGGEGAIEAFTELRWLSVQVEPWPVPPLFRAPTDTEGASS